MSDRRWRGRGALQRAWCLTVSPIITANWKADSDNRLTGPLGAGVGKSVKIGGLPVNVQLCAHYNVVRSDGAAEWQLRAQVQLLFSK